MRRLILDAVARHGAYTGDWSALRSTTFASLADAERWAAENNLVACFDYAVEAIEHRVARSVTFLPRTQANRPARRNRSR